jgi:predicted DNA-binding transcriptional regulator AlpA
MDTVQTNVAARRPYSTGTGRQFSTIEEFCEEHRFSRAFFYKLLKAGKAPRITRVGSRRYVSDEAAAVWRQAMDDTSDAAVAT